MPQGYDNRPGLRHCLFKHLTMMTYNSNRYTRQTDIFSLVLNFPLFQVPGYNRRLAVCGKSKATASITWPGGSKSA
jgi:hypothetical protein